MRYSIHGCLECGEVFTTDEDEEPCIYCGSTNIKSVYELVDIVRNLDLDFQEDMNPFKLEEW
jgi:reverse gyrase